MIGQLAYNSVMNASRKRWVFNADLNAPREFALIVTMSLCGQRNTSVYVDSVTLPQNK